MKEISEELRDRECVVCLNCGAIYEGVISLAEKCEECGEQMTKWITPVHSWAHAMPIYYGDKK